jgi:methyl-accepting chemotaxis protein
MSIIRRMTIALSAMLALLVAVVGIGIGAVAGEHDLGRRVTVMLLVITVAAFIALALGATGTVFLNRSVKGRLEKAVGGIGGAASQILAVASQVAAAAAQTAAATNETTATVEEVKQTAMLAQEKASEASELSQKVVDTSKYGEVSANRNYSHFERIQADMDLVAEAIDRLNEEAQSVGDVIATVNDLAEQSNLLSVNASIEAAKAGDAGKGFTVVAQEVKSLATQSKQAVAQVRAVLSEIQKASTVVVKAAEQGRETVELGRNEANGALENIGARVIVATRAAEATSQIAATSRQQLAGMEQISAAILSINDAGRQSALGTREVEREVGQLRELTLSLRGLVDVATA